MDKGGNHPGDELLGSWPLAEEDKANECLERAAQELVRRGLEGMFGVYRKFRQLGKRRDDCVLSVYVHPYTEEELAELEAARRTEQDTLNRCARRKKPTPQPRRIPA